MKYVPHPIPTSIVRLRTSRILTFENSAFLGEASRGGHLLWFALSVALLIAIFLVGVAAAQADPASLGNQATIVRFTNKVEFGAARHENAQTKIDAAFAHIFAIRNGTVSSASQKVSAVPSFRNRLSPRRLERP